MICYLLGLIHFYLQKEKSKSQADEVEDIEDDDFQVSLTINISRIVIQIILSHSRIDTIF